MSLSFSYVGIYEKIWTGNQIRKFCLLAVRVDAVQRAAQAVGRDAAQLGDEQTPASQGELFQKAHLL